MSYWVRLLLCAALMALGTAASAHTGGSTGYATVTVSGQSVRYSLSVAADLQRCCGLPEAIGQL